MQAQPATSTSRDADTRDPRWEAVIRDLRAMLAVPLTPEERARSVSRFARELLEARGGS